MFKNDKQNIVLCGFMGTGKTSVGKALAGELNMNFVDLDQEIEKREGLAISDIFNKKGEAFFRQIEKEVVAEYAKEQNTVVSTGGGVVLDRDNITALRQKGLLVNLTADPETIFRRIARTSHRPILNVPDPLGEIKKRLKERELYYAQCDLQVETDGKNIEEIVGEIKNKTKIDE